MTNTDTLPKTRSIGYRTFERINDSEVWNELCGRCGGTGHIQHYGHIDGGLCYGCNGSKTLGQFTTAELDKKEADRNKREAKKEADRLAICAKRDARVAALAEAEPEVAALLKKAYEDYNTDVQPQPTRFIRELSEQIHNAEGRELTENQIAAIKRTLTQNTQTEYIANEGEKVTFTGEVVRDKVVETQFGSSVLLIVKVSETVTVKMFTTAQWVWDLRDEWDAKVFAGDESVHIVTITATVKKNEEYNNQKQSQMVRPKYIPS